MRLGVRLGEASAANTRLLRLPSVYQVQTYLATEIHALRRISQTHRIARQYGRLSGATTQRAAVVPSDAHAVAGERKRARKRARKRERARERERARKRKRERTRERKRKRLREDDLTHVGGAGGGMWRPPMPVNVGQVVATMRVSA